MTKKVFKTHKLTYLFNYCESYRHRYIHQQPGVTAAVQTLNRPVACIHSTEREFTPTGTEFTTAFRIHLLRFRLLHLSL